MKNLTKKVLSTLAVGMFAVMALAPVVSNAQGSINLWGDNAQKDLTAKELGLGTQDVRTTIAKIINVALGLLGIVAVCIVLIGGFKWMTAGGEQGKVDEAKKLITSGIIGLAIIVTSYAIAQFVINSLMTATGTNVRT